MNTPLNTRMQRTRSSPAVLRWPLMRRPSGCALAILAAILSTAFAHAEVTSCPETTGGRIEFFAGAPERLGRAETFLLDVIGTGAEMTRIQKELVDAIQQRIPQWRYEADPDKADVVVRFHSGECMSCSDCKLPDLRPRWAYAEVTVDGGLARAKWSLATLSRSDGALIDGFADALRRSIKIRAPWCSVEGLGQRFGSMGANVFEFTLRGSTSQEEIGPLAGARVRWRRIAKEADKVQEWTEGTTDERGRFSGPYAASGTWDVEVCAAGYQPMYGRIHVDYKVPFPGATLVAMPAARAAADDIQILEPSSVVRVGVGTPVRVRWRIKNGPVDPHGWEIRISLLGCADAMGTMTIHTEPFTGAEGGFTWHATQEVIDWIRANDNDVTAGGGSYYSLEGDLELPIMVCLYNAGERMRRNGDDELLAMSEACHPVDHGDWLVCGDSAEAGSGRVAVKHGTVRHLRGEE